MKKFLSICLVALCSVSAMYAESPTEQDDVECGSTVEVSATATSKHFHFNRWEIKDITSTGTTTIETISKGGSSNNYTATSTSSKTGQDNDIEKEVLTVTLTGSLISAATSGTLTFEAFFTEDNKYIVTGVAVNNDANYTENGDAGTITITHLGNTTQDSYTAYENDNITLTATSDDCYDFVKWIDANGTTVSEEESFDTQVTATTTYRAVFEKKKVNIKVTTSDTNKGTVKIESVTPPSAPQQ